MQAQPQADLRAETSSDANYLFVAAGPAALEGIMSPAAMERRGIPASDSDYDNESTQEGRG